MARPKKVVETPVEEGKKGRSANRSKEDRIAALQEKIKYHEDCIESLKKQISNIENKVDKRAENKKVNEVIKASGFSPDEIAEILKKAQAEKSGKK